MTVIYRLKGSYQFHISGRRQLRNVFLGRKTVPDETPGALYQWSTIYDGGCFFNTWSEASYALNNSIKDVRRNHINNLIKDIKIMRCQINSTPSFL